MTDPKQCPNCSSIDIEDCACRDDGENRKEWVCNNCNCYFDEAGNQI